MKKLFLVFSLALFVFSLSACTDQKYTNDTVTVIFYTSNFGSTPVESYLDVEPNSMIEPPEEPSREGFFFNGWYTDLKKTDQWDFDVDTVGETSIVLYAGWDPMIFDIIYDLNGGEMVTDDYPTTFVPGDYEVLPTARRTGFEFVAWYTYDWVDPSSTIPGDSGYQVLPQEYYEDLYLYAHYEAVTVRVTFRSNYPLETGGPDNPSSEMVAYGSEIDFDMFEDHGDYRFIGWNTREDGTGDFYTNGDIFERTQRITLYGVWELIE